MQLPYKKIYIIKAQKVKQGPRPDAYHYTPENGGAPDPICQIFYLVYLASDAASCYTIGN
jgi:hypothetical protein